jgi:glycogen debranching enzyme
MEEILDMLAGVMERMTQVTAIGRILMPGPTYLGMWARDTGVATLGLNRLGKADLSRELLLRYWAYQITPEDDPATFIFRNKRFASWSDADAYRPTRQQLLAETGAFPTSVYIQTPEFPPGTKEIYTDRADLDSACWLIIALHDYHRVSGDAEMIRDLAPQVAAAVQYLLTRDDDGDCLLEQGANQDWADILLRRGKVSYTQAVWYASLGAAAEIFEVAGDGARAGQYRSLQADVRAAINAILLTPYGYYANYRDRDAASLRRSLDTALLVAFDACPPAAAGRALHFLDTLDGPFGPAVIEPGYGPGDIGPAKYPPGQYQNEGIWPWIASYLALAWAKNGDRTRAAEIIAAVLGPSPHTVHEWVDNLNGQQHHGDFATGAGALAWAITEGGLAAPRVTTS